MSRPTPGTVEVTLGGDVLGVPAGGYYDTYCMNADLAEVAKDLAVPSVDFFRTLPKRVVESPIGLTSTPNCYYAMRMVQVAMLAPIGAVRGRLQRGLVLLQPVPAWGWSRSCSSPTTSAMSTRTTRPRSRSPSVRPATAGPPNSTS